MVEKDQTVAAVPKTVETSPDTWEKLRVVLEARACQAFNYVSRFVFILVIYGCAAICEYGLFLLVWRLLADEITAYPLVSTVYHYTRIGLALGTIVTAVIHGVISIIDQVKLDLRFSKEGVV